MKKERKIKNFNDKFAININSFKEYLDIVSSTLKQYKTIKKINNVQDLKEFAMLNGMYLGQFYVKKNEVNKMLEFALPERYILTQKLKKKDDDFVKVIVLANNGIKFVFSFICSDSWDPILINCIDTKKIVLEGNVATLLKENK